MKKSSRVRIENKSSIVTVFKYKGQLCIPIPKEICEELDIHEGTKVSVDITPDGKGIVVRKVE